MVCACNIFVVVLLFSHDLIFLSGTNCFFVGNKWYKEDVSKLDLLRLLLACDAMHVDPNEYIWNMAVSKYGEAGTGTEK